MAVLSIPATRWLNRSNDHLPSDLTATKSGRDPTEPLIMWVEPVGADRQWAASVKTQPGDSISILVDYLNTKRSAVNHVVIRAELPPHVKLIPGSMEWFDSNHLNGEKLNDTALSSGGVDLGWLGHGGGGYILFRLVIVDDFAKHECGTIPLSVIGHFRSSVVSDVERDVPIIVSRPCSEPN